MLDRQAIIAMRRKEQARRGEPLTPANFGAEAEGSPFEAPDVNQMEQEKAQFMQLPEDDDGYLNPRAQMQADALDMDAMDPETTLQPQQERVAQKYGILRNLAQGQL